MKMESLDSFVERLASASPAPGGGAASSLVAVVGAALTSMVAGLTLGKKGYEDSQKIAEQVSKRSSELMTELRDLMRQDEEAFDKIVAAWKMPKSTEDEKAKREEDLQIATMDAIRVPWKIASASQEVLRISALLVSYGNRNAITDAGCSLEFSLAALKGVIQNIRINLKSLKDPEMVEMEQLKIKLFLEDSEQIYRDAMKELERKL